MPQRSRLKLSFFLISKDLVEEERNTQYLTTKPKRSWTLSGTTPCSLIKEDRLTPWYDKAGSVLNCSYKVLS